jgi:energy-coupling factor transporter ATP-binding protein EcfA2
MNLYVLEGGNFSGRTCRLREFVGLPNAPDIEPTYSQSAYIGPDVTSYLSGIAPTVETELELMAADRCAAKKSKKALEDLGFGYCLNQNPFTLSGGEQAVAAVLAATAARPKRLAIDSAFEQLSAETRTSLLSYLLNEVDGDLMVSDNRLDEWHEGPTEKLQVAPDAPTVRSDTPLKLEREPCEIELIDLCHSYVKGKPVFKNLNLRLEAGAHYMLSGPNGSGKTTLSKILCGLIKPTSGEIRINGKTVRPWRTPGKYISYHFQNPDFQLFSSKVNTQLAHSNEHDALAAWFGLDRYLDEHPLDLPFVLKKRVALASALGRKTGYVILDEPTLGQDSTSVFNSDRFVSSGLSGLVISHSHIFSKLQVIAIDIYR